MNTRKKGVFGGVHPQTHLFFGNLVVHTFVDEYNLSLLLYYPDNQYSAILNCWQVRADLELELKSKTPTKERFPMP